MTSDTGLRDEPAEANRLRLIVRVAELLFVHGETTEGIRRSVDRLGHALDLPVALLARWGEVRISPEACAFGAAVPADPVGVDISQVNATETLVDRVCERAIAPGDAIAALDDVARMPPVALPRFIAMAAVGAAALSVIFGANDLLTIGVTAISAGLGAGVRRHLAGLSRNPFLQPFVAALLAGLIVSLASRLQLPLSQQLVAACPCMVLVPGPHFLNGAIDLVRARIALGSARLLFASLIVVAISAGLLIGLSPGSTRFAATAATGAVPFLADLCAAGIAVAAYGAFFNMSWRMLPAPVAIGMAAHALRWTLLDAGASLELGALAGCALAGLCSDLLSRRLRIPFGAISFAAVVALIPGVFMFQTAADALAMMSSASSVSLADLASLAANLLRASLILLAMATGLIVPKMLLDGWLADGKRPGPMSSQ
jgi:uncharacterized membrane protein YjjP (DUF1212 family)